MIQLKFAMLNILEKFPLTCLKIQEYYTTIFPNYKEILKISKIVLHMDADPYLGLRYHKTYLLCSAGFVIYDGLQKAP